MMKRTFDVVLAAFGLFILWPVMAVVAILIKLDSPGPVMFPQTRMGRGFRPFALLKFRTMVHDAQQQGGQLTIGDDARITRVGRVLRRFKLDELPQLFNILQGDMSVVGPRPEVSSYVEMFRDEYEDILRVRPGLTDLASLKYLDEQAILGASPDPEKEYVENILPDKLRLARLYVHHFSFLHDLLLIGETLLRLCGVEGMLFRLPEEHAKSSPDSSRLAFVRKWVVTCRRPLIVLIHVVLVTMANYLAFWLKFDGSIPEGETALFLTTIPFLVGLRCLTFIPFRLYQGLWKYSGLWDLKNIIGAVTVSSIAFFLLVAFGLGRTDYPASVMLIDALLLVVMLGGIRLSRRIVHGFRLPGEDIARRVLIVGAGDAGEMIVRDMLRQAESRYVPVGFVDDDPAKIGQSIHGIRVVGTCGDLPRVMNVYRPEEILLAIPRANSSIRRRIVQALQSWNVPIKTLPSLRELLECKVGVTQIRPLAIEDLLGRDPVYMETERVRELVAGKRVLVTGAGGSIGSELCRQIMTFNPRELVLYERYENSLHSIQTELETLVGGPPIHPVIGDVTDRDRLEEIMLRHRPQLVFHAAAHKHVPLMELNSCEAVKNNVLGTQSVAMASDRHGVERFVLISTDKAVNPTSVMGATKRVAELVVQDMAKRSKTCFTVVRFGNVLGSNGSVVPAFKAQIQAGGPVTVTHREMRRYFMLIPEAVHLVLQAATLGEQGALYVLEMGEQVKVYDLARNLIRLSGFIPEVEIPISIVGLRSGEKLYEELVGKGEEVQPSPVDKIHRVRNGPPPETNYLLKKIMEFEETANLKDPFFVHEWLRELVPTFQPGDVPTHTASSVPMVERVVKAS